MAAVLDGRFHILHRTTHGMIKRQRLAQKCFTTLDPVVEPVFSNAIAHQLNSFILIFAHQDTK